MMYIDTSVIAAYYCPEPFSGKAERAVLEGNQPAISSLTELELVSALGRKVRERALPLDAANRILDTFRSHLDKSLFKRIALRTDHYAIAFSWLSRFRYALRTLDALHLAVAQDGGLEMLTADRRLYQSARRLGIRCRLLS